MATNNKSLKILVARFSSIGDIVLCTPVIRILHRQLHAEVHFLCKEAYRPLLQANPYLEKQYTFKKSLSEVMKALRAENYDYIIDLHKNLRSRRLFLIPGPKILSFDKLNFSKWLLTNFRINRLPNIHIVDRYLEAVATLGISNDGEGLDYFIPPSAELNISGYFAAHSINCGANQFIAFAIGAAHATKRLPQAKINEICGLLKNPVLLLGGTAEQTIGDAIAAKNPLVVNACGKLNLHQSASVIRQAGSVITHDTGMMHIAAAFKKKIVSVWGNTVPEFGMTPYFGDSTNRNQSFQVSGLPCRPCSKIGYASCPKGHFRCMEKQDALGIARAATF